MTPSLIEPINSDSSSNDGYNEDDEDENCKTDIEIDSNQKFGRIQSRKESHESWIVLPVENRKKLIISL